MRAGVLIAVAFREAERDKEAHRRCNMLRVLEWYALQVRPRTEKFTVQLLNQKGYEPFLPTYLRKRRWSDRVKVLSEPLFPGYLFCRLDARFRLPVLTTPSVISIVGAGKEPI